MVARLSAGAPAFWVGRSDGETGRAKDGNGEGPCPAIVLDVLVNRTNCLEETFAEAKVVEGRVDA
jgi:hypothetical protein